MAPFKNVSLGGIKSSFVSGLKTSKSTTGIAATSFGSSDVITSSNGYRYHYFTQPGKLVVDKGGYVDYFVVGGGGAGGVAGVGPPANIQIYEGGGGGAGGISTAFNVLFPAGTYTIFVGPGGVAPGGAGSSSYIIGPTGISSITAGGGQGGGGSAGSGGVSGTPQSNAGGTGTGLPTGQGGGGGGAGAVGANAQTTPSVKGGDGGNGITLFNADSQVPSNYGTPGPTPGRWFGGGGGGGGDNSSSGGAGGGSGGPSPATSTASNATRSTGGGGGGVTYGHVSGNGAPGIVVIRYRAT